MSIVTRPLDVIYFGHSGQPEVKQILIQKLSMGSAMDVPIVSSLFPTPAPTVMLAITFLRAKKTYTVHFPDYPHNAGRRLRNQGYPREYVLVCRSEGVLVEYSDCDDGDIALAIRAADFALAYCKGKSMEEYNAADMQVRVCEYIRPPVRAARKTKVAIPKRKVARRKVEGAK